MRIITISKQRPLLVLNEITYVKVPGTPTDAAHLFVQHSSFQLVVILPPGDLWATGIFLIVTSRGMLLVSSGYRPGMLLKVLLCTTPTTKNSPAQNVSGGEVDPC